MFVQAIANRTEHTCGRKLPFPLSSPLHGASGRHLAWRLESYTKAGHYEVDLYALSLGPFWNSHWLTKRLLSQPRIADSRALTSSNSGELGGSQADAVKIAWKISPTL